MIILLSVRYIVVMVEKHNFHIPRLQFVLLPSRFSLSNSPPGYLGIHTTSLCLASHHAPSAPGALSIPSLRTLGPHISPAPLLSLLDPLPGKCPLASNSQLVPCRGYWVHSNHGNLLKARNTQFVLASHPFSVRTPFYWLAYTARWIYLFEKDIRYSVQRKGCVFLPSFVPSKRAHTPREHTV